MKGLGHMAAAPAAAFAGVLLFMAIVAAVSNLAAAPAGKDIKVKLGACDWTLGKEGDWSVFEMAAKLGLDGIQASLSVRGDSLALTGKDAQRACLEAAERSGVAIASFAIGRLNDIPLKSDPLAEKLVLQAIDICAAMKVNMVLIPFFGKGELRKDPAGLASVIEKLKRLAPRAEKAGVVLGLESYLSAPENLAILKSVGSPAVKVYYDVGNSHDVGNDVAREIKELGNRICQFHAKDTKGLYGKGSMDFNAVRQAMEEIGYDGWLVIEGTEMPLGIEKSVLYDLNYLRTIFPGCTHGR